MPVRRRRTTGCWEDLVGGVIGGIYYGLDDFPEEQCVVAADPFSDCLLLADDFSQYYLGAFNRNAIDGAASVVGTAGPMAGDEAAFGGPATVENPVDEAGAFTVTSDLLPPERVPAVRLVGRHRLRRRRGQHRRRRG